MTLDYDKLLRERDAKINLLEKKLRISDLNNVLLNECVDFYDNTFNWNKSGVGQHRLINAGDMECIKGKMMGGAFARKTKRVVNQ